MPKQILISILFIFSIMLASAQQKEFECDKEWIQQIIKLAPDQAEVQPVKKRKVLVFSLFTGFNHWVIPHTNAVIKVLGEKSGAFEVEISNDIFKFEKKSLKQYDAVVLNNNCSVGPRRDLFMDVLDQDETLTAEERTAKAAELEENLIKYVEKGGGLMVVHGAIVMQNNSMAFSEMVGGSFDYHPAQQELTLELAEPNHPLVKAFDGKGFVHVDEPYLFNKAYAKKNFRPLLYMDSSKLTKKKKPIDEQIKYVSWIKRHGKGRVFYVSPSHNAQSFEDSRLLKFYLDGAQYVLGDLKCDDSPANL
ncbi:ThuA domain-containing protein [Sunxiuqinia rutila]|uniref:ThuA domain-containing protein n=1 Tax=Sunxiuqinia rutila TaxID=1397841 RepID=UPI003D36A8EF